MSRNLSRRELILRGAFAGAALALPGAEAFAAVREGAPRESFHCLPLEDRFTPDTVIPDCTFASFAPDGLRIALATSRGIELFDRRDGSRKPLTGPGFTLTADAWHKRGAIFLAGGPAEDGSGPYIHAINPDTGAIARLLPEHPGPARAACFSPDGKKVAFTYVNGYTHLLCMADWTNGLLTSPVILIPFDPAAEPLLGKLMNGLSYYETRGWGADGSRLYFASDRGSGMLNANVHYIELASATRRRVTFDQGFLEGAVISPDDRTVYFSGTRAREVGYMTLFTGPSIPPVLGFVAAPNLHEKLATRFLARIGNGDILAVDETYGMGARMIGKRDTVVAKLATTVPHWLHRTIACSMSADGTELAVATLSSAASAVVLLRRPPSYVPRPVRVRPTPASQGAVPLGNADFGSVDRTFESEFGGRMHLKLEGDLSAGDFQASFEDFNSDGVKVFAGAMAFQTGGGGFRHSADVARVNFDTTEDARTYYKADMRVDWPDPAVDPSVDPSTPVPPTTGGTFESLSRTGSPDAAWDGTAFTPQHRWKAGRKPPESIPGSQPCRNTGQT